MVAAAPGAPNTSITTCLGLNDTISLAALLGVDATSWEPKMPLSWYTADPATAKTRTANRTIQWCCAQRPIETRCIGDPFNVRLRPFPALGSTHHAARKQGRASDEHYRLMNSPVGSDRRVLAWWRHSRGDML